MRYAAALPNSAADPGWLKDRCRSRLHAPEHATPGTRARIARGERVRSLPAYCPCVAGDETPYDEVARVLARGDVGEGGLILDRARVNGRTFFRAERFLYALYRARLADQRGSRDEAAAFARGALWQISEDEEGPQLSRHPDVGRVNSDQEALAELWHYVRGGDAERYGALIEDYRSPVTGHVQWHWSLIEQLRPNPSVVGPRHAEIAASRLAAEPILLELRAAGVAAYDLADFARQRLPSRKAADILVSWLPRVADPIVRSNIAIALTDAKARSGATQPLLHLFRRLPNSSLDKDRVAAALGTLARDDHFEQVAELARDSRHGQYRQYLFWAVGYMQEPRAVDLCLELLGDAEVGVSALRALADLRSTRARPVLQAIASESATRGRSEDAQRQRERVRIAQRGIDKLDRAVAAGKARP